MTGREGPSTPRRLQVVAAALAAILLLGEIDHLTGADASVALLYLIPIAASTWLVGPRVGLLFCVLSDGVRLHGLSVTGQLVHPMSFYWSAAVELGFFIVVAMILARLRATTAREATMARTDPLTGLFNRRAFIELATREVARAERYHRSVSIAYMDIDKFKAVNDAGGHKEGDRLLVQVAETLRGNLRSSDVVARYGGDEFVVLLPDTGDAAAEAVLEKLMGALRGATRAEWPATFSIGFITVDRPSVSLDRLVQEADTLAYAAKRAGGDCVRHRHLELGGAAERVDSVRNAAAEKVEYPKALAGGRGR